MPGKFRYRLQKVLDFRAKREEQAKQALSDAKHHRDVQQDLLDQLSARHQGAQRQLGNQLQSGSGDVQMSNDYVTSLEEKIKAQKAALAKAEAAMQEANKRYVEASKEAKIMEKHREKEYGKWLNEEKRLEAINLDEMASTSYLKKRNQEALDKEEEEEEEARQSASASPWIDGLMASAKRVYEERQKNP
ncbi:MAG: flagellar export protein FliJ [Bacteroidota bacterium]